MSDKYLICLVKFFDQEEHADQFRRGKLYLNRLSYFMGIETDETDLRADPYEAVTTWQQPGRVWYKIVLDGGGEFEIPENRLSDRPPTWKIAEKYKHVFCMYAVTVPADIAVLGQDGESALGQYGSNYNQVRRISSSRLLHVLSMPTILLSE